MCAHRVNLSWLPSLRLLNDREKCGNIMKFTRSDTPLQRLLQMFGLVFLFHHPPVILWGCIGLSVHCLFHTNVYWIPLAYVMWYIYDMNQDERGGRRWHWLRRRRYTQLARDYFQLKLVKTADLPTDRNFIFGSHPHGIIGASSVINFATEATGFSEMFPGKMASSGTSQLEFIVFEVCINTSLLWENICSVQSDASCHKVTTEPKMNQNVILIMTQPPH